MSRRKPHAFDSEIIGRYKFTMPKQFGFPNRIAGILIRLTAAVQENEPDQRTDPGDGGNRAYILIASAKFGPRQLELSRSIKANQKRPNILNE